MLWQLSAQEAAAKVRSGEVSSVDLTAACLERIEASDTDINAWAFLDQDQALSQAQAMDELRRRGRALGALHGVPVGIKDIFDTNDAPTGWGTRVHSQRRPARDSAVIDRLRDAGAVIMGKTVTAPLAFAGRSVTRNPHNREYSSGASSSGSAAAVAAGHVPLAVGTQTNGSVIRPASYCGVFGLKPTRGMISRRGCLQTSATLDQVGTFGRTLGDVALLADVLAGHDSLDQGSIARPRPGMQAGYHAEVPAEPVFAWVELPFYDRLPSPTRQGINELLDLLGDQAERIEAPKSFMDVVAHHRTVHAYEFLKNLENDPALQPGETDATLQKFVEFARGVSDADYERSLTMVSGAEDYFATFFNDYDAIVAPSSLGGPPKFDDGTGDPICSTIWTFAGLPCLSLPWLTGEADLPAGLQLIGAAEEDDRLLRTAAWLEGQVNLHTGEDVSVFTDKEH